MLRVRINDVEPGMTLALPVQHPHNAAQTLLRSGFTLDARSVRRLHEMQIQEVWIECPGLELVARYVDPEILKAHGRVAGAISSTLKDFASGKDELSLAPFRDALKTLLDTLVYNPRAALFMRELAQGEHPLLDHSTNVCYLSLLMGLRLGGYLVNQRKRLPARHAKNVTALALGAMLHDVGLLKMDPMVYNRWRHDQNDADPEYRKHPEVGYEAMRGKIEPSAANIILHHHQRFDGRGFPKVEQEMGAVEPLKGEQIHIFSRIVAAADWYDRLRRPAQGPFRPQVKVHSLMQGGGVASGLDPIVYRALLSVAPPYPPGLIVTLSDDTQAVVTALAPREPCRPTVQRIEGELGDRDLTLGEEIDLREHTDLWIAKVDNVDVSDDNFYAQGANSFDVLAAQSQALHGELGEAA